MITPLNWLFKRYDELDDEAKKYVDSVKDEIEINVRKSIPQIVDPIKKRQVIRQLAKAKGEHFDVNRFLKALESPSLDKKDSIIEAYDSTVHILQKVFDLVYDISSQKGQDSKGICIIALLHNCIDEIIVASHLVRHNYHLQAIAHLRNVIETIDKVKLFNIQPEWIAVWIEGDYKKLLRDLSPASVRKKLGSERYDPIYGLLSELGIHTGAKILLARVSIGKKRGETQREVRTMSVGGTRDEFLALITGFFLIYVVSILFNPIIKFGEGVLNQEECIGYAREAIKALHHYYEFHYLPIAEKNGLDTETYIQAIKELEKVILKTIAAFSNGHGGILSMGVSDNMEIIGLDNDYNTLKDGTKDSFELHLRNLVNNAYGVDFAASNLIVSFPVIEEVEICVVEIKPGIIPLYTKVKDKYGIESEKFYLRSGNSSPALETSEVVRYIRSRFDVFK